MAAATVNIPAIVLSGRTDARRLVSTASSPAPAPSSGRRANACRRRDRLRRLHGHGRLFRAVGRALQHHGHGALHELACRSAGHVAARLRQRSPRRYRERGQMAYATGKRIVEMVAENLRPSDIMTRKRIRKRRGRGGGAGRFIQLPDSYDRDCAAHGCRSHAGGLAGSWRPTPRCWWTAARGTFPWRKAFSRGRRAGRDAGIAGCRPAAWRRDDGDRAHAGGRSRHRATPDRDVIRAMRTR